MYRNRFHDEVVGEDEDDVRTPVAAADDPWGRARRPGGISTTSAMALRRSSAAPDQRILRGGTMDPL